MCVLDQRGWKIDALKITCISHMYLRAFHACSTQFCCHREVLLFLSVLLVACSLGPGIYCGYDIELHSIATRWPQSCVSCQPRGRCFADVRPKGLSPPRAPLCWEFTRSWLWWLRIKGMGCLCRAVNSWNFHSRMLLVASGSFKLRTRLLVLRFQTVFLV